MCCNALVAHVTSANSKDHWQFLENCLPSMLCKGAVKESRTDMICKQHVKEIK